MTNIDVMSPAMPADETSADKLAGEIDALGQRLPAGETEHRARHFRSAHDHRSNPYHAAGRRSRAADRRARARPRRGWSRRSASSSASTTKRVQCTPDLMPADIVGSEVLEESDTGRRSLPLHPGPGVLPAADGRRDQPRQPAHPVGSAAGHAGAPRLRRRPRIIRCPRPFHVLATQNPLEQEGTYPLPEAQLDRFLMEVDVPYPDLEAERQMLIVTDRAAGGQGGRGDDGRGAAGGAAAGPARARRRERRRARSSTLVRSGRAESSDIDEVPRATSPGARVRAPARRSCWPPRARAVLDGRFAPSIDDVLALAHPVLRHRMALSFSARADGVTLDRRHRPFVRAAGVTRRARPRDGRIPALRQRAEHLASTLPALQVAAQQIALTVAQGVAWPPAGRPGRCLLAVPPLPCRRSHHQDRLAQIGQVAASVRARDRMGGGAERLAVARRLAVDALSLERAGAEKLERAELLTIALAALLVRGGERIALTGSDAAPRPARPPSTGSRSSCCDRAPRRRACRRSKNCRATAHIAMFGDFLSPLPEIEATVRAFADQGVHGHLMQVLDPAEELLPFAGRVQFEGLEGEGKLLLSRVESVRADYARKFEDHHQGLMAIARTVGWSYARTRTDSPPQPALLALYQQLVGRGQVLADVDARQLRLRRAVDAADAPPACRCCGGCCV